MFWFIVGVIVFAILFGGFYVSWLVALACSTIVICSIVFIHAFIKSFLGDGKKPKK